MKYILIYVLLFSIDGHEGNTVKVGPVTYTSLNNCQKGVEIIKKFTAEGIKVEQAYCLEVKA